MKCQLIYLLERERKREMAAEESGVCAWRCFEDGVRSLVFSWNVMRTAIEGQVWREADF